MYIITNLIASILGIAGTIGFFYLIYALITQVIYTRVMKMILFDIQNGKIPDFNKKLDKIIELLEKDKN